MRIVFGQGKVMMKGGIKKAEPKTGAINFSLMKKPGIIDDENILYSPLVFEFQTVASIDVLIDLLKQVKVLMGDKNGQV